MFGIMKSFKKLKEFCGSLTLRTRYLIIIWSTGMYSYLIMASFWLMFTLNALHNLAWDQSQWDFVLIMLKLMIMRVCAYMPAIFGILYGVYTKQLLNLRYILAFEILLMLAACVVSIGSYLDVQDIVRSFEPRVFRESEQEKMDRSKAPIIIICLICFLISCVIRYYVLNALQRDHLTPEEEQKLHSDSITVVSSTV